jgi:hypothetical protein
MDNEIGVGIRRCQFTHMNAVFTELLIKALTQRSQCRLEQRKGTRNPISVAACEDHCAAIASLSFDAGMHIKRQYSLPSKGKNRVNIDLCGLSDILGCYIQEPPSRGNGRGTVPDANPNLVRGNGEPFLDRFP